MIVNMVNVESSDRGLPPHKFMPMLGVHMAFERNAPKAARPSTLRYAAKKYGGLCFCLRIDELVFCFNES